MSIIDDAKEATESYSQKVPERIDLSGALEHYHDLVRRGVIVPRGNQLIPDTALFQNSNIHD